MSSNMLRYAHHAASILLFAGLVACGAESGSDAGPPDGAEASESEPGAAAATGGALPEGWSVRPDRGASAGEVRAVETEDGLRVSPGPAAILWDSTRVAEGDFTAHATFTRMSEPEHPEAYGLFVGGRDLRADEQDYLYFLIRPGGEYLVKHRAGSETHTLVDWSPYDTEDPASGDATTHTLAIDAGDHGARFLVDDTEVASLDPAPMLVTDGVVGLRINHNLDVRVTDFGIE